VIEVNNLRRRPGRLSVAVVAALLTAVGGCAQRNDAAANQPNTTLSIGFGENPEVGIRQMVTNLAVEGLLRVERDGRPSPWLAERWSVSHDGLRLRLQLQPHATFHNGQPASAAVVREIIQKELPGYVGPIFDDVLEIQATSDSELEFVLKRRSNFLLEGLDVLIRQAGDSPVGTGPFTVSSSQADQNVEMQAYSSYYGGKPSIDRIAFKSYSSVRSAWADMLRGQVDMLYEVGADALDSLRASSGTKIYPFQRSYAFLIILNTRDPKLRDRDLRRALNTAVDRPALINNSLDGHGTVADGPVWPYHWAYNKESPRFRFEPRRVLDGKRPLQLTCLLVNERSHERLGLALQQQLRAVGVNLEFEQLPSDQVFARVQDGAFEAALIDLRLGPSTLRQYQAWYSGAPYNWGQFSSAAVDRSLDQVRDAPDDSAYRAGVANFQKAILDDPPAIFIAWGERLRAVSTRFEVPAEPGKDVLTAPVLRLWQPVASPVMTSQN
jgi:peptide/nickel transport system substrate-binding protein